MAWRGRRARGAAAVLVLAAAAGCTLHGAVPRDKGGASGIDADPGQRVRDSSGTPPRSDEQSTGVRSEPVDPEYDWAAGAVQTTTPSGVTFAIPGDWQQFPESEMQQGEEVVYLWQDGQTLRAESVVLNTGGAGDPDREIAGYLEAVHGVQAGTDNVPGTSSADVPGADDARRADYTYDLPGGATGVHGTVVALTAATDEVVLFTVSGGEERITTERLEEIASTLRVGPPPDGGV